MIFLEDSIIETEPSYNNLPYPVPSKPAVRPQDAYNPVGSRPQDAYNPTGSRNDRPYKSAISQSDYKSGIIFIIVVEK